MSPRALVRALAISRIAIGAALILAPRRVLALWLGSRAATPEMSVVGRGLGIRDAILGGMLLHTLDHPQVARRWTATCGVADAVDGAATFAAGHGRLVGAGAFVSSAAHVALARQLVAAQGAADGGGDAGAAQSPPAPASSPETVMPDGAEEAKRMMGARTIGVDPPGA